MFLLVALTGCNSTESDLSSTIIFEDRAECRFAPVTRRIFSAMIEYSEASGAPRKGRPLKIAGVGELQPSFSGPDKDGMLHAKLPLKGSWQGLTLIGLGHGFVPNSGVHYNRIVFAETPEKVREKLNTMGLDLPAEGRAREFGGGMTEYISLGRYGSGSVLECST